VEESKLELTTDLIVNCCFSKPLKVGRLAFIQRRIGFEYDPEFLELGIELSPFKLPLKPGLHFVSDGAFEGLFGLFNDSLPDGWGRLLLDRKLRNQGFFPDHLTPLDRLRYVGLRGMGVLQYKPAFSFDYSLHQKLNLDLLAQESLDFELKEEDHFLDDLINLNGSSAGARPKILVSVDPKTNVLKASDNLLGHTHNDWLIKFRSSIDPPDIGSIEYAYHLMAKKAGLDVSAAKLFKSKKCSGYFGVKRFDRASSSFYHMHTLSGLLHADHRIPCLDYQTIMKATAVLTKSEKEQKKQFRHAVFNVFSHNRDDHAKNFSFLMNESGSWSVSPAYDLTFSSGPGSEHCTTVLGNGKNPGQQELLKLATMFMIDAKQAVAIIDEVKDAVSQWKAFAKDAGVSKISSERIEKYLSTIR